MRIVLDPGKERRSINFLDNIVFSRVTDLNGGPVELRMSLCVQNGNSEMRLASGVDDEVSTGRQPVIVWINGAGWRGCDKNLMAAEMLFLAEHGYALACIDYRGSDKVKYPGQLQDCKTAIRFLRAHADEYGLDPDRIGTIGRSAGGYLSACMAMNLEGFDTGEWSNYSSQIQAAVDFFGPVDLCQLNDLSARLIKQPGYRWNRMEQTHEGCFLGGDMSTLYERCRLASPIHHISDRTCPIAIFHGDEDPLVPLETSEDFYRRLVDAGLEEQSQLYVLRHGGHGTRECFQNSVKERILAFFDRYLRK